MDKTHYADYDTLARIAELEEDVRFWNTAFLEVREQLETDRKRYLDAQLRNKELREALESVKADLVLRAEIDSETSVAILNIGNGVLRQMNEALATPDATPELDALMRDAARIDELATQLAAVTAERDEYRAALKEINDCPTWAVGTLIADRYSRVLAKYTHEDDIEQARRTS